MSVSGGPHNPPTCIPTPPPPPTPKEDQERKQETEDIQTEEQDQEIEIIREVVKRIGPNLDLSDPLCLNKIIRGGTNEDIHHYIIMANENNERIQKEIDGISTRKRKGPQKSFDLHAPECSHHLEFQENNTQDQNLLQQLLQEGPTDTLNFQEETYNIFEDTRDFLPDRLPSLPDNDYHHPGQLDACMDLTMGSTAPTFNHPTSDQPSGDNRSDMGNPDSQGEQEEPVGSQQELEDQGTRENISSTVGSTMETWMERNIAATLERVIQRTITPTLNQLGKITPAIHQLTESMQAAIQTLNTSQKGHREEMTGVSLTLATNITEVRSQYDQLTKNLKDQGQLQQRSHSDLTVNSKHIMSVQNLIKKSSEQSKEEKENLKNDRKVIHDEFRMMHDNIIKATKLLEDAGRQTQREEASSSTQVDHRRIRDTGRKTSSEEESIYPLPRRTPKRHHERPDRDRRGRSRSRERSPQYSTWSSSATVESRERARKWQDHHDRAEASRQAERESDILHRMTESRKDRANNRDTVTCKFNNCNFKSSQIPELYMHHHANHASRSFIMQEANFIQKCDWEAQLRVSKDQFGQYLVTRSAPVDEADPRDRVDSIFLRSEVSPLMRERRERRQRQEEASDRERPDREKREKDDRRPKE